MLIGATGVAGAAWLLDSQGGRHAFSPQMMNEANINPDVISLDPPSRSQMEQIKTDIEFDRSVRGIEEAIATSRASRRGR